MLIEISNCRESLNQKIRERKKERETGVNWRRKKKKKERKKGRREKKKEERKRAGDRCGQRSVVAGSRTVVHSEFVL